MYFDCAFINAFGNDLVNCRIYTNRLPYSPGYNIAADDTYSTLLNGKGLKRFCDNFKPKLGDEIHLVPDSAYSVQDVRNNYKLKRKFDSGVCNVFSPILSGKGKRMMYDCMYYDVRRNIVCLICKSKNDTRGDVALQMSSLCGFNIDANDLHFSYYKSITYYRVNEAYVNMLTGNHTKPCIYYDDLDMNRNELTLDQLCMLYESSKARATRESVDNYCVQLSAISQSNWKEYPGTMYYLLNDILKWNSTHYDVSRWLSGHPKQIREIFNYDFGNNAKDFANEKDKNMLGGVIEYILNIGDCRFATFEQLSEKLSKNTISTSLFNKFYNTMTKITPKRNEE